MAICLPTVAAYSLLWLPSLPSVLLSLLYAATLLCLPNLHYNSLALCRLVCAAYLAYIPMLLSAVITYSYTPCLVYMVIQYAVPK